MVALAYLLESKLFLWLLLIGNFLGTIYGYMWYGFQLEETVWYFIPFVPDSPTASLFFCFVLVGFICGRHFKLFEALALMSLVKYGVWAVGMNVAAGLLGNPLTFANYLLIVSHGWMAIQGLLYIGKYRFGFVHFSLAAIWLLHNEIIDYVFDQMPIYPYLQEYSDIIGYITFWLSIGVILLSLKVCLRNRTLDNY